MYYLNFQLLLTIFLVLAHGNCDTDDSLTVEYYKNLIQTKVVKAQTYALPENNKKFEQGAASKEILEYPGNFHFIIVGGGTAGCVLATRLSENPNFKIALIEAGGWNENDFSQIPNMALYTQFSGLNWGYYTAPQKNCCLGMVNQKCMFPRGEVLGGSSSIGFGIYRRSSRSNFNEWAEKGWPYRKSLRYYKKSENSHIDGDDGYHGKGGLMNVKHPKPDSPFQSVILKAEEELNLPYVDYNGRQSIGVSKPQINFKHGRKQSTSTTFLEYARNRKNLEIITDALVIKVLIGKNNKTKGVLFVKDDKKYRIKASKEVILSAGPINTPQLLMLSGIGPREHLKEKGINVIKDSPVGKTLRDNVVFPLVVRTNISIWETANMETVIRQYLDGYGSLVKPLFVDLLENIHTDDAPKGAPMFENLIAPPGVSHPAILARIFNYNTETTQKVLNDSISDMALDVILIRPKSKGSVTLNSSNPIDFPIINANYFSDPDDIKYGIERIKTIEDVVLKTKALRAVNATLVKYDICTDHEKGSDGYWECLLRLISVSAYEPRETTPMGLDPETCVVDKQAKVYGVLGLRIVDAGIFSSHISSQADTIMAAEVISDLIKNEYQIL